TGSAVRDLFAALAEVEREESLLLSRKAVLVARIAEKVAERQIVEERQTGKGIFSFAAREAVLLELGPALGVSSRGAEAMLSFAEDMTVNYPRLGAKLAAAEVTAKAARFVGENLGFAPSGCREELDSWLAVQAPRWRAHSYGKISQLMEAQFLRLDPEWCRQRRERAHKSRSFTITPVSDGMADLRGTMPLEAAAELRERLDAIARTVCPDDPRPLFARHSDALAILGEENQLVCECGKPSCKAAQRPAHHPKNIELVVQLPALIGKEDIPALLDGAPIDLELARMLAKTAKRIRFTTTPDQYKPTPALETHVNARDQHCRFPGCYRRARTELDHTVPFDHENPESGGQTIPENLSSYKATLLILHQLPECASDTDWNRLVSCKDGIAARVAAWGASAWITGAATQKVDPSLAVCYRGGSPDGFGRRRGRLLCVLETSDTGSGGRGIDHRACRHRRRARPCVRLVGGAV
ncbi:MAG: DUF222 domain-containing protein, partial [Segniliparus sp.]|uniref:DUF222 domain-containing protein n=1 Tax=Segniliparus sp. TaxID=2804064 RepID=UPI003F3D6401